jgi:hypothetical protein
MAGSHLRRRRFVKVSRAVTLAAVTLATSIVISGSAGAQPVSTSAPSPHSGAKCVPPPPLRTVSWWPAEGTASDVWGTNNGALANGTTFAPGMVGQAFQFDGVDDAVWIPDSESLALTRSLTLEAWIYPSAIQDQGLIMFRGDSRIGLDPYYIRLENDGVHFMIEHSNNQGDYSDIHAPVKIGKWQHIAGTLDNATGAQVLYVNGAVAASTTTSVRPLRNLTENPGVAIGNLQEPESWEPFSGLIDEATIYRKALSAKKIHAIYKAGSTGKCLP